MIAPFNKINLSLKGKRKPDKSLRQNKYFHFEGGLLSLLSKYKVHKIKEIETSLEELFLNKTVDD